jgi:hypothetical protein
MIRTLTFILVVAPFFISAQSKFPPRDDSGKSPELQLFVNELKEIIRNKDAGKLLQRIHPRVQFDFDEGVGIEKFRNNWKPADKNSELWAIMDKIVGLGGVFVKNNTNPFFTFVFPYVNEIDLEDADQYFNTLVVTAKDVQVRERPDLKSKVVGQLTYDVVIFDYEKSENNGWYFVQTTDKKISGYVSSDFVYCPVDYRMFLTQEKGKWMISCLVAGD